MLLYMCISSRYRSITDGFPVADLLVVRVFFLRMCVKMSTIG